jgi:hypothetical protein
MTLQWVSGMGQVHRRHLAIAQLGINARTGGHHAANDVDATEHQGFQSIQGHCRPPANGRKGKGGRREGGSPHERVGKGFYATSTKKETGEISEHTRGSPLYRFSMGKLARFLEE